MAWDTSKLTPEAIKRVDAGEPVESVASSFGVHPDAIRQYCRKFDAAGRQIAENMTPKKLAKLQAAESN